MASPVDASQSLSARLLDGRCDCPRCLGVTVHRTTVPSFLALLPSSLRRA